MFRSILKLSLIAAYANADYTIIETGGTKCKGFLKDVEGEGLMQKEDTNIDGCAKFAATDCLGFANLVDNNKCVCCSSRSVRPGVH